MNIPLTGAPVSRWDHAAFALALAGLAGILLCGLLPGLLALLAGHTLTRALTRSVLFCRYGHHGQRWSGVLVIAGSLCLMLLVSVEVAQGATSALQDYQALADYLLAATVAVRDRLPAPLAGIIPAGGAELRAWLGAAFQAQVPLLAGIGKSGAFGLLLVQVGIILGALAAAGTAAPSTGPLGIALRQRGAALVEAFGQIMLAQLGVATVNAVLIALYLFAALPLCGLAMPHAGWLVALTFVAGLLPIVGNLLCNVVMTIAGLGVSVQVGLASLAFLVALHKLEYLISARIVGGRIATSAWELVAAIIAFESVFGVAGIVAAPLVYAYAKLEMKAFGWV